MSSQYHSPLPDPEIRNLIRRARDESLTNSERTEARNAILLANTGWRIAQANASLKRWPSWTFDADDLASYALFGEIKAIERFDLTRMAHGKLVRYITFASWWIYQSIGRARREHETIIARPRYIQDIDADIAHGREPRAHYAPAIDRARQSQYRVYSLDATIFRHPDSGECCHPDPIDPRWNQDELAESEEHAEQIALLRRAIKSLDPRARSVIESRMRGRKLVEIGKDFGVSRERVRQIELKAKARIKEYMIGRDEVLR